MGTVSHGNVNHLAIRLKNRMDENWEEGHCMF
jgi:hypothetical protein